MLCENIYLLSQTNPKKKVGSISFIHIFQLTVIQCFYQVSFYLVWSGKNTQDPTNLDCTKNLASSVPKRRKNIFKTVAPKIEKDWLNHQKNPQFDHEVFFFLSQKMFRCCCIFAFLINFLFIKSSSIGPIYQKPMFLCLPSVLGCLFPVRICLL